MWTVSYFLYAIIVGLLLVSYRKSKGALLKELIKKLNVIINNRNKVNKIRGKNKNNNNDGDKIEEERNDILNIPGPLSIPLFGTKWIYFWKYQMTKIHEAYKGKILILSQ